MVLARVFCVLHVKQEQQQQQRQQQNLFCYNLTI